MSKIEVNAIEPQCGTTLTVGASGDTITFPSGTTVVNNGSQTGFGRTGTVDWDTTPKTATFSAVSGNGYFCNTTSSAFTVNLPAGSAGAIISLADYAATWQTNNVTVTPNGTDKIGSLNENAILSTEGQSVTFVYVDSTQGWINTMDSTSNVRGVSPFIIATGGTITECGDFKIHTFTGPGTFCVSKIASCAVNNEVSHIVVAGGASGALHYGGGGGAGGFRENKSPATPYTASPLDGQPSAPNRVTVTETAFPITVGGGGAAGPNSCTNAKGTNGSNSVFSTIISAGGGGGGVGANCSQKGGLNGGSGGGSGSGGPTGTYTNQGTGNSPPTTPPQGNDGGTASRNPSTHTHGGGGGGATVVGTNAGGAGVVAGCGGAGATTSINGSSTAFAGGGGGASNSGGGGLRPNGGTGGGGRGGGPGGSSGSDGTDNTGGGGGAGLGSGTGAGAGGSGIVIIRYKFQ